MTVTSTTTSTSAPLLYYGPCVDEHHHFDTYTSNNNIGNHHHQMNVVSDLLEEDVEATSLSMNAGRMMEADDDAGTHADRLQQEQQARRRRRRIKGSGSSSSNSNNSSYTIWNKKKNTNTSTPTTTLYAHSAQQQQQQQHHHHHQQHRQQRRRRHHPNKPPSPAQRAGLFMLFAILLTMWHYMRTVWWTHGRLASRHARFLKLQQQHEQQEQGEQHGRHHYQHPGGRMIRASTVHLDENFQNEQASPDYEEEDHKIINRPPMRPAQRSRKQQQQPVHERDEENNHQSHDEENTSSAEEQRQRGRVEQQQQGDEGKENSNESRSTQQRAEPKMNMNLSKLSIHDLQALFVQEQQGNKTSRRFDDHDNTTAGAEEDILAAWLDKVNHDILNNVHGGIRWVLPTLLPPVPAAGPAASKPEEEEETIEEVHVGDNKKKKKNMKQYRIFLDVWREKTNTHFAWQEEWSEMTNRIAQINPQTVIDSTTTTTNAAVARYLAAHQPVVDYTSPHKYQYPPLLEEPPPPLNGQGVGQYPQLTSLTSIMEHWDQDEDYDGIITETLMHFNYSNPNELETARKFRNAELPFKLTNVPELVAASQKWTDEYLSQQFDDDNDAIQMRDKGLAQESPNHYFAYYNPSKWHVETMGLAPVRTNDWTFATWAEHAKYADAVQLSPDQPHFYWQAGIGPEERSGAVQNQSFISRDLPSWSSTTENFITFEPKSQKGIQCRFGERGIVAATHYDAGRNMVGMITGAKRYILSPPKACNNLGIVTSRASPIFRHSLLNFGHLKYLHTSTNDNDNKEGKNQMSKEERAWLERASQAQAVETVVKAGEVLYIPSFWFHYIISLQKSAQCNVRSGIGHDESTSRFGGEADVLPDKC